MNGRPELIRRAAAEGIGVFALVFAGCGAMSPRPGPPRHPRHGGYRLVFGLVIMAMIYATGHLSGAHINPAVTSPSRDPPLPLRRGGRLLAAQVAGASAGRSAAASGRASRPRSATTVPTVGVGSALAYEAVLTAFLMFVIMAVATDTRAVGAGAALAIGGTVGLDALFGGPITGASMNPARSFGPALVSGTGPTSGSTSSPRSRGRLPARSPTN